MNQIGIHVTQFFGKVSEDVIFSCIIILILYRNMVCQLKIKINFFSDTFLFKKKTPACQIKVNFLRTDEKQLDIQPVHRPDIEQLV